MNKASKRGEVLIFSIVLFMLIFSPLFRGGNLPLPIAILEISGLLLFSIFILFEDIKKKISLYIWLLCGFVIVIPWVYLIPISESFWTDFLNREIYQETYLLFGIESPDYRLSLIPWETLSSALFLIAPISLFLAIFCLAEKYVMLLVYVFIGILGVEAVVGLAHYLLSAESLPQWLASLLNFKEVGESHRGDAHGTYANRDHFAALMAMGLSICFAVIAREIRQVRYKDLSALRIGFLVVVFSLVVIALVFSRSRAGISLGIFSVFCSAIIFSIYLRKENISPVLLYGVPGFAILIASSIGVLPTINRFIGLDPTKDGRVEIFENTITGIKTFFPLGSGPGTFDEVYRAFQPITQKRFINHAHNDYLELFFETGLIGFIVLALFFLVFIMKAVALFRRGASVNANFHYIQIAALISTVVLLLHGLVDFNFHIPANVIFFAFLLGVFFYTPQAKGRHLARNGGSKKPRVRDKSLKVTVDKNNSIDWRNKKNPFQDKA
jgi:O-antigen ligase